MDQLKLMVIFDMRPIIAVDPRKNVMGICKQFTVKNIDYFCKKVFEAAKEKKFLKLNHLISHIIEPKIVAVRKLYQ